MHMLHQGFETVTDLLRHTLPTNDQALEDLAHRLGYKSGKILQAFRSGDLKVPLDRAFELADAIGVDEAEFFRLCMKQFLPEPTYAQFLQAFGRA
jgi:hypothetical protein